ncbi:PD40 domain-containing protein [Candidatus Microgenomates bacterium]|nr:PD40 domain-containing protein [Candidatus Microgenomates bacterium]
MSKKNKILLAIIIGSFAIAIILVYFFSNNKKNIPTDNTDQNSDKQSTLSVEKIADQIMLFPAISPDGEKLFYFSDANSQFFSFNLKTKESIALSERLEILPEQIWWSPQRDKVIVRFTYNKAVAEKFEGPFADLNMADNDNAVWLYDLLNKKASRLSSNIENIAWSPDGSKIIYHYVDFENNFDNIAIANPDGSSWRKLADVSYPLGAKLGFISSEKVFYYQYTGSEKEEIAPTQKTEIMIADIETNKTEKILDAESATGIVFPNNNNSLAIYERIKDDSFSLGIFDLEKKEVKDLDFYADLDRITILNSKLIAISIDNEKNIIHSIDLKTGAKNQIMTNKPLPLSVDDWLFDQEQGIVYFTSGYYPYRINLTKDNL